MNLKDYLTKFNLTQAAFAEIVELDQTTISLYVLAKKTPRQKIQKKIHALTGGLVSYMDWINAEDEVLDIKPINPVKKLNKYEKQISRYNIKYKDVAIAFSRHETRIKAYIQKGSLTELEKIKLSELVAPRKNEIEEILFYKNIREKQIKLIVMASILGLSESRISQKIKDKSFTLKEIFQINKEIKKYEANR